MYAVTPDDATTKTDDTPRLITTEVPDSPSGLDDGPIGEESPDANDRNPFSPRSDVSGDPLDLEQGLPDDAPIFKGARNEGDDEYLPLSTLRQATAARNLRTAAAPTPDAASLTMTEVTKRLRSLGFRIRSTGERDQAIRAFKTGWFKLGPSLMDGTVANSILGPKASKAIDLAYERDKDGLTTMSPHFSFIEARCKCGGNFTDCRRIWPTRQSVIAAEACARRSSRAGSRRCRGAAAPGTTGTWAGRPHRGTSRATRSTSRTPCRCAGSRRWASSRASESTAETATRSTSTCGRARRRLRRSGTTPDPAGGAPGCRAVRLAVRQYA